MTTGKPSDLKCTLQCFMGASIFCRGKRCSQTALKGQFETKKETAGWATRWLKQTGSGKANYCCHPQLQQIQFRFDRPKEISVFIKCLQKKNHFQARTHCFLPFCWVMTDLTEGLSIGEVEEPHKYKLKCSSTSFPWNTVSPCKFCNVSSWIRGRGEQ